MSRDGKVRAAEVQLANGHIIDRPISNCIHWRAARHQLQQQRSRNVSADNPLVWQPYVRENGLRHLLCIN